MKSLVLKTLFILGFVAASANAFAYTPEQLAVAKKVLDPGPFSQKDFDTWKTYSRVLQAELTEAIIVERNPSLDLNLGFEVYHGPSPEELLEKNANKMLFKNLAIGFGKGLAMGIAGKVF
jgi:hypothetical protein